MKQVFNNFWSWYERHYAANVGLATGLFVLQLAHLYWLSVHVIALRLLGESFFNPTPFWQGIIVLIDYLEIPALLSVSLIFINDLRRRFAWKTIFFLILLNSQWLHLFWITDEVVLGQFLETTRETMLPSALAWLAIVIDYLELPVMIKVIRKWLFYLIK